MRGELSRPTKLLFAAIICGWAAYAVSLLGRSFWIDEAVTYWIAAAPLPEVSRRAVSFQGNSPLFFLLEHGIARVFGASEPAMRAVSFFATILAAIFVHRIARRMFDEHIAFAAVLVYCSLNEVLSYSVIARPYALALLAITVAVDGYLQWLAKGGLRPYAIFLAATAAAAYLQPTFLGVLVLYAIFLFTCRDQAARRSKLKGLLAGSAAIACVSLPAVLQVSNLQAQNKFQFVPVDFVTVARSMIGPALLVAAVCAAFINRIWERGKGGFRGMFRSCETNCVAAWWLIPQLLVWAVGGISGNSLFQSRYGAWYLPGLAILVARIVGTITPAKMAYVVLVGIQSAALVCIYVYPPYVAESWRELSADLAQRAERGERFPVLVHSTMMESMNPAWMGGAEKEQYLLAPFSKYPIPQAGAAIPWWVHRDEDRAYMRDRVLPLIDGRDRVFVVTRAGAPGAEYLEDALPRYGLTSLYRSCRDAVCLLVFEHNLR
jgi:uncharacterized membrane protein